MCIKQPIRYTYVQYKEFSTKTRQVIFGGQEWVQSCQVVQTSCELDMQSRQDSDSQSCPVSPVLGLQACTITNAWLFKSVWFHHTVLDTRTETTLILNFTQFQCSSSFCLSSSSFSCSPSTCSSSSLLCNINSITFSNLHHHLQALIHIRPNLIKNRFPFHFGTG